MDPDEQGPHLDTGQHPSGFRVTSKRDLEAETLKMVSFYGGDHIIYQTGTLWGLKVSIINT